MKIEAMSYKMFCEHASTEILADNIGMQIPILSDIYQLYTHTQLFTCVAI
jgi:hypothetical protein